MTGRCLWCEKPETALDEEGLCGMCRNPPSIMLQMAEASRQDEMWGRRFQYLCRAFEPDKRFVDQDGRWGLRDFLAYAGEVCGFAKEIA